MFLIFLSFIDQILISVLLVTVDCIEISIIRSCCDVHLLQIHKEILLQLYSLFFLGCC